MSVGRPQPILAAAAAGVTAVIGTATSLWLSRDNGIPLTATDVVLIVSFYAYLIVGLVLVVRRPENRVSWLLLAAGWIPAVGTGLQEYARLALVERPGLPGGYAAAWFNELWWFANLCIVFIFIPLLFPTGRLLTTRWRWVARGAAVAATLIVLTEAFGPDLSGQNGYEVANPLAVSWVQDAEEGIVGGVLFGVIGVAMLLTLVSLGLRFRRSRGIERQQLKWFVLGGAFTIGLPLLELLDQDWAASPAFDFSLALLPIAIGLAVLRYRLYDIDRLISRTVAYALLTAVLVAVYLAAVTALTAVTAPVTENSPVAVAAATLLAAAAFGPARRRIQSVVDRRFNRARYDAAQTVEEFRARLRDELDLAAIGAGMAEVLGRTVQPTRMDVWLRPETPR